MQPWKRFSLVSHFLIVLLVFGQPGCKEKWIRVHVDFFFVVNFFVVQGINCTSKKVAVSSPNSEGVGDLERRALLLINGEGQQVVSGCQVH